MARWFATSTQILKDPKMVRLGEKHGGAAVSVVIALLAEAMLQEKGGTVEYAYRNLAHDAFTDRVTAEAIVADAGEVGLINVTGGDADHVEVNFPAWARHQAAFRKAKSRATNPASQANVTPGHEKSQKVTIQDKTGQETTGKKKKASGKPSDFDLWLAHYHEVTGKTSVTGSKPARQAFAARIKEGKTLDDLKWATFGCHGDDWCRQQGYDVPETILRASKVERYIALAQPKAVTDPVYADNVERYAV